MANLEAFGRPNRASDRTAVGRTRLGTRVSSGPESVPPFGGLPLRPIWPDPEPEQLQKRHTGCGDPKSWSLERPHIVTRDPRTLSPVRNGAAPGPGTGSGTRGRQWGSGQATTGATSSRGLGPESDRGPWRRWRCDVRTAVCGVLPTHGGGGLKGCGTGDRDGPLHPSWGQTPRCVSGRG